MAAKMNAWFEKIINFDLFYFKTFVYIQKINSLLNCAHFMKKLHWVFDVRKLFNFAVFAEV